MKLMKTMLACAVGLSLGMTASAGTLDDIRSTGTIKIAYREASIPFSYLDATAKPTGFAWEISNKVAEAARQELGLASINIKPQVVTSANRIPLIVNGTVDIECGSTTNNAARAKEVDFSVNFFYTGARFIVRANSGIKTIDDLKGRTIVSTSGTSPLQAVQRLNHENKLGMRIITSNDHDAGFLNVQQGLADAFVMDEILIYGLRAAADKPEDYIIIGEPLNNEAYGCMVRQNDPDFKALVDRTIIGLMESGEFTEMYNRWFLNPIPPKNITLGLEMPEGLKANLVNHSDQPAE